MRVLYSAVLALAMIGAANYGPKLSAKVIVFWVPLEIETYLPVTAKNIEQRAFKIVAIRNERQAGQVISLIRRSNQRIEAGRIRIKISTDTEFYNFDAEGIGVSSKGEAVKIDIQKLKQVLCH